MSRVRPEQVGDQAAIDSVVEAAFDGRGEADLVAALRRNGRLTYSMVAELEDRLTGHAALSPVVVQHCRIIGNGLGLAPVSVHPDYQGQGIGSSLVRALISRAQNGGYGYIVVLGASEYYRRFGFVGASRYGLRCPYDAPEPAFQVIELKPDALKGVEGLVRYAPEFGAL